MNNQIYYTVYKTTNLINGKIYIGCHQTEDPYDDYLGSGKIIKESIHKHGADSFTKEVLYIFDNADDMYAKEAELVDKDFIQETDNYNLVEGGSGASSQVMLDRWKDPEYREKMILTRRETWQDPERRKDRSNMMKSIWEDSEHRNRVTESLKKTWEDPELRQKARESTTKRWENPEYREKMLELHQGRSLSKESKERISKSNTGKVWIYSYEEDREEKIPKDDPIPEGWVLGQSPNREKPKSDKIWIYSYDQDRETKIPRDNHIPDGWSKGRKPRK